MTMILYHYTNTVGLQGILKSRSLWASDYRFLNDTREFHYGLDIVTDTVRSYEDDLKAISASVWLLLESLRSESTPPGVTALSLVRFLRKVIFYPNGAATMGERDSQLV